MSLLLRVVFFALSLGQATGVQAADTGSVEPGPASIWPRLVAGMQLGGEKRPEVQRFIKVYKANPQYFTAMLARAEPFLWFILNSAELRRLPAELALLPTVESNWNAQAVSVAAAQGLWQFIPKTSAAYGLRNGDNYQASRDPVASTRVALDLLIELHHEFGDWPLALAAYNAGGVRVRGAIKAGKSRDYWQLPLPQETRDYVPRLLAIAALVRNPKAYGLKLPQVAESGVAEVVTVHQESQLHLALQASGVDESLLKTYNPGLARTGSPTQAPTLLLPPSEALVLRAELAALQQPTLPYTSLRPRLPAPQLALPIKNLPAPKVQPPTQTAAVPEETFYVVRRAPPRDAKPPVVSRQQTTIVSTHPAQRRLGQQLRWSDYLGSATAAVARQHEVRAGETLFAIARHHGLSLADLQRSNPEAEVRGLRVGQQLVLNR